MLKEQAFLKEEVCGVEGEDRSRVIHYEGMLHVALTKTPVGTNCFLWKIFFTNNASVYA